MPNMYYKIFIFLDCLSTEQLPDGYVIYSDNTATYNTTVSFYCNEGFYLVGNSVRICLADGRWDGSSPFCIRKGKDMVWSYGVKEHNYNLFTKM